MKKSKFVPPYHRSGTTFPDRNKSGVYLIKKRSEIFSVTYIGMSKTDIYTTMYRHFQRWNDKRFDRKVYEREKYLIRVIYCTPLQAVKLERALIIRHNPKDNAEKYDNYTLQKSDKDIIPQAKETETDELLGSGVDVDF